MTQSCSYSWAVCSTCSHTRCTSISKGHLQHLVACLVGSQESTCHICQGLHTVILLKACRMRWQGKHTKRSSVVTKGKCYRSDIWSFSGARAKGSWGCWGCCSPHQLAGLCPCQSAQPCSRRPSQLIVGLSINPHHQAQQRHSQAGGIAEVSCHNASWHHPC